MTATLGTFGSQENCILGLRLTSRVRLSYFLCFQAESTSNKLDELAEITCQYPAELPLRDVRGLRNR